MPSPDARAGRGWQPTSSEAESARGAACDLCCRTARGSAVQRPGSVVAIAEWAAEAKAFRPGLATQRAFFWRGTDVELAVPTWRLGSSRSRRLGAIVGSSAASPFRRERRRTPRRNPLMSNGLPPLAAAPAHASQSSRTSPGIRLNSAVLCVTRTSPFVRAMAAMSRSLGPISRPSFSSWARRVP